MRGGSSGTFRRPPPRRASRGSRLGRGTALPKVKFTTDKGARESRLLLAALLLLWVGRLAAPVHAHPVPFSYLDLRLGPGQLDGVLVAHTVDLARELHVTPADALLDPRSGRVNEGGILGLLRPRLVLAADGRALGLELSRVEPLPDRQALALHLRFREEGLPGLLSVPLCAVPLRPAASDLPKRL